MKKWIFMSTAVMMVSVVLFFYVSFNGNIISKAYAKHIVKNYAEELFEGRQINIVESFFNFKDGDYTFKYEVYDEDVRWLYSTSVSGPFFPSKDVYTILEDNTKDYIYTKQFEEEGRKYIMELLQNQGIATHDVHYFVQVPSNYFKEDIEWKPNIDRIVLPEIYIDLKDEQQSQEQFVEITQRIQQQFEEISLTYLETEISITREYDNRIEQKEGYADIYYETLYSIQFNPGSPKITLSDIIE